MKSTTCVTCNWESSLITSAVRGSNEACAMRSGAKLLYHVILLRILSLWAMCR